MEKALSIPIGLVLVLSLLFVSGCGGIVVKGQDGKSLNFEVIDSNVRLNYGAGNIKIDGGVNLKVKNDRTFPVPLPLDSSFIGIGLEFSETDGISPQVISNFESMRLVATDAPVTLYPDMDNEVELILPTQGSGIGLDNGPMPTLEDYRNVKAYFYIVTPEKTHKFPINTEINIDITEEELRKLKESGPKPVTMSQIVS